MIGGAEISGIAAPGAEDSGAALAPHDCGLNTAMEEVEDLLRSWEPDPAFRLSAVRRLFRMDSTAPYALAIEALTGEVLTHEQALQTWELAVALHRRWSGRLGETVRLKAAAAEAVDACRDSAPGGRRSQLRSCRSYLGQDSSTGLLSAEEFRVRLRHALDRTSVSQPVCLARIRIETPLNLEGEDDAADAEALLRHLGQIVRQRLGRSDAASYAGDGALLLLMPSASEPRAITLVQELLASLRRLRGNSGIRATAGIAVCRSRGRSVSGLHRDAAGALARAEAHGPWSVAAAEPVRQGRSLVPLIAAAVLLCLASCWLPIYSHDSAGARAAHPGVLLLRTGRLRLPARRSGPLASPPLTAGPGIDNREGPHEGSRRGGGEKAKQAAQDAFRVALVFSKQDDAAASPVRKAPLHSEVVVARDQRRLSPSSQTRH